MNAYTLNLIIVLVCGSLAEELPYDDYLNVGTVLFSSSDLTRSQWDKFSIALLQARQYFQTVIPPPNYIDVNEDYVDKLLNYFRDAYSLIKYGCQDSEVRLILNKALSDTLGGYLKQWILPITKLAFYGGTINSENANKLMNFYNEVKKYLDTDGAGWTQPDPKLMSFIRISVVRPTRMKHSKTNVDPCKEFAYLETTIDGLTIPMPYIDWQEKTMFIPLKDFPLIALTSPKHALVLSKYYDAAKSCLDSKNTNATAAFEKRFQMWLNIDVLPHLNDNTLYVALGSVLGLSNKTQVVSNTLTDMSKYLPQEELYLSSNAINCCKKKTVIICIILIIEIIWCFIALRHACLKKHNKRPGGCFSEILMYFKADRNDWNSKQSSKLGIRHPSSWTEIPGGGIKFYQKPRRFDKQYDFGAQKPSSIVLTRHTTGSNTKSSEFIKINNKRRNAKPYFEMSNETSKHTKMSQTERNTKIQPKKMSRLVLMKDVCVSKNDVPVQVSPSNNNTLRHPQCNCSGCPAYPSNYIDTSTSIDACTATNASNTVSFVTIQEMPKTVTLFKRNQRSIERAMRDSDDNTIVIRKAVSARTAGLVVDMMSKELSLSKSECACVCCDAESICPCLSLQSKVQTDVNELQEDSPEANFGKCSCHYSCNKKPDTPPDQRTIIETVVKAEEIVMSIDKEDATQMKNIQKATKIETLKEFTITRNTDSYTGHPFMEIKIDRPNAEISVGISAGTHSSRRSDKSRIPKKALTPTRKEDKSANHSVISDEALKFNEQIINEAVRSYRQHNNGVKSKQIDNDELINFEAMRTSNDEKIKAKVERNASRKRDSKSRTISRYEEVSDVPLEIIEHAIDNTKENQYKSKVPVIKSKIPSKVVGRSGNTTKERTIKLDRNMDNDSNKPKNPDVALIPKATAEARTRGIVELNKTQIRKPGNVIRIYKDSTASPPKVNRKSLIPHLKKNTADDTKIVCKKAKVKDSKLNITL